MPLSLRLLFGRRMLATFLLLLLAGWLAPVVAQDMGPGQDPGYGPGPGDGPGMGPGDGMGPGYGMGPGDGPDMGPGPRMRRGDGMGSRDDMGGPGDEPGGMGPDTHVVTVHGQQREYVIHVPPHPTQPAPLVLLFHGGGGRPEAIERRTGMDEVADRNGFVVVYPAGAARRGGEGRGGRRRLSWNIGGGESPSSADDVSFVRAILRDVEKNMSIDHARIYATGLSMGGVFSYRLGCEMSGTFAAIAPVAATMVERGCNPTSPVAVLHLHGDQDPRIPVNGGTGEMTASGRSWPVPREGLASWSHFDSCGAPEQRDEGGARCTVYAQCRAAVEYCVFAGVGHDWPASASEQIWGFFATHPKQAP